MKTFVASLLMRFVDRLSGPARAAARAVGDVKRAQDMAARASAQWSRGLNDLDGKLDRLAKVSLVTEGMDRAGRAMSRPLIAATQQSAAFDQAMTGIGITAQMTDRQLAPLRANILRTASDLGAMPAVVQATYGAVLAEGVYRTEADLSQAGRAVARFQKLAETMNDPISNAEAGALSAALGSSYRMASGQLDRANAMINRSAQLGGVGIGSIARVLPEQSGALVGLNFANETGMADLLAANQIAKRLAGNSDQATNNISNLMGKLASPEVIKNFGEIGINLEREIKRGVAAGRSPLMTLAEITKNASKADQFRIGELVGDVQAKAGLMALVQNLDDFKAMSRDIAGDDALSAYMADLERASGGPAAAFARYTSSIARAGIATGTILSPAAAWAANVLERVANWMAAATESGNPLARAAVMVAAGLAGGAVAAAAVGNAVMGILGPWFIMKSMFGTMGGAAVAAGFAKIAGGIATTRNAVMGLNLAMLANPVGLMVAGAVAAVAIVALVVRKYWGPISAFMTGVGSGIADAFRPLGAVLAPLRPVWTAIAGGLGAAWRWVTRLLAPVKATESQLKGATSAGQAFGRLLGRALLVPLAPILIVGAAVRGLFGLIRRVMSWSPAATIQRLWSPIATVASAIWSRVVGVVGAGIGRVAVGLMRFTPLGAIVRNWSGITGFLGKVWTLAAEVVGLGIDSLKLVLLRFTPIGPIVRNWAPMVTAVGRVWSGVRGAVGGGIGIVGGLIQRWNPAVLTARAWLAMAPAAARAWANVRGQVGAGTSSVLSVLMRFTPLGPIVRAWGPVTGFVAGVWTRGRALVTSGIAAIGAAIRAWSPLAPFQAAFASVFGWLEGLPRRFSQIGTNIVQGMTNGIRGQRAAVQAASAQAAGGAATAAQRRLGIRSPSRVFARLGDFAMQGLALGLDRSAGQPIARVAAMAGALAAAVPAQAIAAPAFEIVRAVAPAMTATGRPSAPAVVAEPTMPAPAMAVPAFDIIRAVTSAMARTNLPVAAPIAAPAMPAPTMPAPAMVAPAFDVIRAITSAMIATKSPPAPPLAAPSMRAPANPAPPFDVVRALTSALAATMSPLAPALAALAMPVQSASRSMPGGEVAALGQTLRGLLAQPQGPTRSPSDAPPDRAPIRLFGLDAPTPRQDAGSQPQSPSAAPVPPAAAPGAAMQTVIHHHHRYGDQTFHVAGGEKNTRELARELQRIAQSRSRAAMNDGDER